MNRYLDAAFFDFDGVITESNEIKASAFEIIFSDYPEEIRSRIVDYHLTTGGKSRFVKFKYIYDQILNEPLSNEQLKAHCDRFEEVCRKGMLRVTYVPGALNVIKAWSETIPLYIITGAPLEEARRITENRKISDYFHDVFGSPVSKIEWVQRILQAQHYRADRCLFIGDAQADQVAAAVNDVPFIGRLRKGYPNPFTDGPSIAYINNLTELESSVLKHFTLR